MSVLELLFVARFGAQRVGRWGCEASGGVVEGESCAGLGESLIGLGTALKGRGGIRRFWGLQGAVYKELELVYVYNLPYSIRLARSIFHANVRVIACD